MSKETLSKPKTVEQLDAEAGCPAPPCSRLLDLRLADCMDVMREAPDNHWDLAIVDPPYGIRVGDNKRGMGRRKGDARATYDMGDWDHDAPPLEYFAELRRVSRNQIVWGANHFIERLPLNSPCWIVWDKMFSNEVSFAAAELAWTSFKTTAKKFQCHPLQDDRIHPTQKPVELMQWCISKAGEVQTILDPFAGSGTTGEAAKALGKRAVLIEREERYCEVAARRLSQDVLPLYTENPQLSDAKRSD